MGAISKPTQDQNAKNSPTPMAPAATACEAGRALNAFTGLSEAIGRPPCANMNPSKISSITISEISPMPSTRLEILMSK